MPPFSVNVHRSDPYKASNFRVRWDGQVIHGVSKVSPLVRTTEAITYREGGQPARTWSSPGSTTFPPLTLARGVTHDLAFEAWADLVWAMDRGVQLRSFRKDIRIELLNEAGQTVKAYDVFRSWPIAYQALSTLDAAGGEVAMEELVLAHEGWRRDGEVTEPMEPG